MSNSIISGIYQIKNKINGKSYIGQSKDIYHRWNKHKEVINPNSHSSMKSYPLYQAFIKYGINNFDFIILEECSIDELNEREIYWIEKLNTYINEPNSQGYNLTRGGEGTNRINHEKELKVIDMWNDGKNMKEIVKTFNIDWHSAIRIVEKYCDGTRLERRIRGNNVIREKLSKSVIQYDQFGRKIMEYPSVRIAAENLKIEFQNLQRCIWGKIATFKNNYFIYKDEQDKNTQLLKLMRLAQHKPVIQIKNNNFIKIYLNLTAAGKAIKPTSNAAPAAIGSCASGRTKSSYGYQWKFLVDYLEETNFDYEPIKILLEEYS